MGTGPEVIVEVRQPLLTIEVMFASAGPGALHQIGMDLPSAVAMKPRMGVAWRRFQLGSPHNMRKADLIGGLVELFRGG